MGQAESNPESSPRAVAFRQALNRLGWTEGRNLRIDYRNSAGETNRMHADAKQLIGLAPDVVTWPKARRLRRHCEPRPPPHRLYFCRPLIPSAVGSLPAWRIRAAILQ